MPTLSERAETGEDAAQTIRLMADAMRKLVQREGILRTYEDFARVAYFAAIAKTMEADDGSE